MFNASYSAFYKFQHPHAHISAHPHFTPGSNHITNVCRSGYYQLWQLHGIVQLLTPDAVKMLIHAFITSRLDYCNSLLGVTDQQLKHLQSVQNAATHLLTGARRSDHITPVLQSLHWLPGHVTCYKIAILVHKCLNGHAPQYLIDECCLAGGLIQGHAVLAIKCLKSPGAIQHLVTIHLLQQLHKSGTVYLTLCGTLLYVNIHLLSV